MSVSIATCFFGAVNCVGVRVLTVEVYVVSIIIRMFLCCWWVFLFCLNETTLLSP